MPRIKRITLGGYVYHVLNRANGRLRIFRKDGDFLAFEQILAEGIERYSMRLCGYCIMSNHWHLLVWPLSDGDLPEFMRWITLTHTQRFHVSHGTVGIGHLYQGRYKSFPVQTEKQYQQRGSFRRIGLDNRNCFENEFGIDVKTARKTQKMYRTPLIFPGKVGKVKE